MRDKEKVLRMEKGEVFALLEGEVRKLVRMINA